MKRLIFIACIFVAWASCPIEIHADTWPRLDKESKLEECAEALQVATAVFRSNEFALYAPPVIPAGLASSLVLEPDALDISGGDALKADQNAFEKLPQSEDKESSSRSLYWQKNPTYGYRLVVQETPFGWRGDQYSLYVIGEKVSPEEFLAGVAKDRKSLKFTPLISDSWRPPFIFRMKQSGQPWVIDVGQPYQYLGDWHVYAAEPGGMKTRCTVKFHPNANKAIGLLPQPIRNLAGLLDRTIGSGKDEGTLQQTARLRLNVEHTWANAALRPWALREPYNTRHEVNSGLKAWSRRGAANLKTYHAIQRQYPAAGKALAGYYQKNFHRPAGEAQALAAYALDIAFRSHYVFQSDDPDCHSGNDKPQSNPWRSK